MRAALYYLGERAGPHCRTPRNALQCASTWLRLRIAGLVPPSLRPKQRATLDTHHLAPFCGVRGARLILDPTAMPVFECEACADIQGQNRLPSRSCA